DVDAAHGRFGELLLQKLTHLEIRVDVRRETLRRRLPLRCPLARNAEAISDWIDFLTHKYSLRSCGCRLSAVGRRFERSYLPPTVYSLQSSFPPPPTLIAIGPLRFHMPLPRPFARAV